MNSSPTETIIRSATWADLPFLETLPFSSGLPSKHRNRLERQDRDEVLYLLAVRAGDICGHLLLKWNGPELPQVRQSIPSCAEIEDFLVAPAMRNQGVGSAMLERASALCRECGESRLGLGVGDGNPDARRLYERHGFRVVPGSAHRATWLAPDGHGGEIEEHEDCTYLLKELS